MQARRLGGIPEQCTTKFFVPPNFCSPQILLCPDKNCFKHVIKTKVFPSPKIHIPPKPSNLAAGLVGFMAALKPVLFFQWLQGLVTTSPWICQTFKKNSGAFNTRGPHSISCPNGVAWRGQNGRNPGQHEGQNETSKSAEKEHAKRFASQSRWFIMALLQPLRWCCVDCVIHHERDVREEQHHTYTWHEQAIIEWSWHVNSIVACCHSVKLCAHAARDFRSQQLLSIVL